jgi:hypothetical protein
MFLYTLLNATTHKAPGFSVSVSAVSRGVARPVGYKTSDAGLKPSAYTVSRCVHR